MTKMKRVTVSLPDDVEKRLARLKQSPKYNRVSYSEMVRQVIKKGLGAGEKH